MIFWCFNFCWRLFWRRVLYFHFLAIDMAPKIDARIIGYGSLARSPVVSPSACFFLAAMPSFVVSLHVSLQEKHFKKTYKNQRVCGWIFRPRLHLCIKVTQEPPAGLKASLHRTYTTMITQETLDKAHSWIQVYKIIIVYCGDALSNYMFIQCMCFDIDLYLYIYIYINLHEHAGRFVFDVFFNKTHTTYVCAF